MDVLINLIVVNINVHVYQIPTLYTLNAYNFVIYISISLEKESNIQEMRKRQDNEVRTADYTCVCVYMNECN